MYMGSRRFRAVLLLGDLVALALLSSCPVVDTDRQHLRRPQRRQTAMGTSPMLSSGRFRRRPCTGILHPGRLSLRGGDDHDDSKAFGSSIGDGLSAQSSTPWGESAVRATQPKTADADSCSNDIASENCLADILGGWRDADDRAAGVSGCVVTEYSPDGSSKTGEDVGFWGGQGLARCSALYCDVADLIQAPSKGDNSRDPRNLLFWLQMQASEVVKRVSVPAAKERRQQALLATLATAVHDIWGQAAILTPYGSAAAGYGTVESDLDLQLSLGEEWDRNIASRMARRSRAAAGALRRALAHPASPSSASKLARTAPASPAAELYGDDAAQGGAESGHVREKSLGDKAAGGENGAGAGGVAWEGAGGGFDERQPLEESKQGGHHERLPSAPVGRGGA